MYLDSCSDHPLQKASVCFFNLSKSQRHLSIARLDHSISCIIGQAKKPVPRSPVENRCKESQKSPTVGPTVHGPRKKPEYLKTLVTYLGGTLGAGPIQILMEICTTGDDIFIPSVQGVFWSWHLVRAKVHHLFLPLNIIYKWLARKLPL